MRTLNFEELKLNQNTLDALKNANFNEATSFQQSVLSHIKNKQNVLVKAESEDDKYTTFAIAAFEVLQNRNDNKGAEVIILTTRAENARAVCEKFTALDSDSANCVSADDAGSFDEQAKALNREPAIVVANPDRLQSLLQKHRFIFRNARLVILDDIKQFIDGNQEDNLKRIKRRILSDYTTVACAGAYNDKINRAASLFAKKPAITGFSSSESEAAGTPPPIAGHLKQGYINVPYRMKISTLMAHIDQNPDTRCVIFTASKRGTDRLYRVLKKRSLKATSLHGKLSDEKRAQRFANFTNGDVQYLLISDISAAQLDLNNVEQVINYDVPNNSDEYRFRAALAASASSGQIVSLVSKQDQSDISELQNELGQTPDEIPLPDKVKEKLKQRKNKKSNGHKKRGGNGRSKKQKKKEEMQLPQPSYDKLSGGRSGNHDKKETGIVKFFKKLFS